MKRTQVLLLALITVAVASCGTPAVTVKENKTDISATTINNFRYDFSCTLAVFAEGALAVDAIAFNKKIGVYNVFKSSVENTQKQSSKRIAEAIEKLDTMKWGSASSFLNDSYIECMNNSQEKHSKITADHMRQVTNVEECMREYERVVFIQLALNANARKDRIASAFARYIEWRGEMLTESLVNNIEHDIDVMSDFDSVESMQGYAVKKYFSCKSRHQSLYRNLSPEKLYAELQKRIKKQKM